MDRSGTVMYKVSRALPVRISRLPKSPHALLEIPFLEFHRFSNVAILGGNHHILCPLEVPHPFLRTYFESFIIGVLRREISKRRIKPARRKRKINVPLVCLWPAKPYDTAPKILFNKIIRQDRKRQLPTA